MQSRIFMNVIKKAKKPKRRSVSSKRIRRIKLLYVKWKDHVICV